MDGHRGGTKLFDWSIEDYANRWQADDALNETTLSQAARDVFEEYSHIPPTEVIPHILAVRRKAFNIHPYPCIGQYRFLNFSISIHPAYSRVLSLLKADPTNNTDPPVLLDVGCCLGQDLRRLVFDGVPAGRLIGMEYDAKFIELGHELFQDKESFKGAMLTVNLLDGSYDALFESMGKRVDIVHAASFFHLFSWDHQVEAAVRLVGMMKDKSGVMVIGRQVGSLNPGHYPRKTGGERWLHDEASWQRLWDQVGEKTETKWKAVATIGEVPGPDTIGQETGRMGQAKFMTYEVTRTS